MSNLELRQNMATTIDQLMVTCYQESMIPFSPEIQPDISWTPARRETIAGIEIPLFDRLTVNEDVVFNRIQEQRNEEIFKLQQTYTNFLIKIKRAFGLKTKEEAAFILGIFITGSEEADHKADLELQKESDDPNLVEDAERKLELLKGSKALSNAVNNVDALEEFKETHAETINLLVRKMNEQTPQKIANILLVSVFMRQRTGADWSFRDTLGLSTAELSKILELIRLETAGGRMQEILGEVGKSEGKPPKQTGKKSTQTLEAVA